MWNMPWMGYAGNAYWLGFGPTNTGFCRASVALDLKDYDMAVAAAEGVNPQLHSNRARQAAYWVYYGRALARQRGRQDDAVRALRQAELIVPHRVQRDPLPGTCSPNYWRAHGGTRSVWNCVGWPTARVCRCSPSSPAWQGSGTHSMQGPLAWMGIP